MLDVSDGKDGKKPFYYSITFWGAIFLGLSTAMDELTGVFPEIMPYAKGLGVLLTAFGIRRALK